MTSSWNNSESRQIKKTQLLVSSNYILYLPWYQLFIFWDEDMSSRKFAFPLNCCPRGLKLYTSIRLSGALHCGGTFSCQLQELRKDKNDKHSEEVYRSPFIYQERISDIYRSVHLLQLSCTKVRSGVIFSLCQNNGTSNQDGGLRWVRSAFSAGVRFQGLWDGIRSKAASIWDGSDHQWSNRIRIWMTCNQNAATTDFDSS